MFYSGTHVTITATIAMKFFLHFLLDSEHPKYYCNRCRLTTYSNKPVFTEFRDILGYIRDL